MLIRQVAERLISQSRVDVNRMYVEVMTIYKEYENRVLCLVGDSSGKMLAYLNKRCLKKIRVGDVVRLLRNTGQKRMETSRNGELREVLFLNTEGQDAKVLPHRHEFLEVFDKVIGL